MARPHLEKICGVMVTYYPDESLATHAGKIIQQLGELVIVDNGSPPPAVAMLRTLPPRSATHLILNDYNVGIAAALNQGMEWARERGDEWVLLLDQDSEPTDSMVESLIAVYDNYPEPANLAIIGSNYYRLDPGRPEYTTRPAYECLWVEKRSVITSGSLVSLDVISQIGPFRDGFFIDHVDDEYCFRARRNGFAVVMSCAPLMKHAIGTRKGHRLPGHTAETSNHSPLRRYYMSRNYVLMAKEYAFREPDWVLWKSYKLLKMAVLITVFERDRSNKLRHMLKGVIHGIRGKLGKMDEC